MMRSLIVRATLTVAAMFAAPLAATSAAHGADLLVTGFWSNRIERYSESGAHLGSIGGNGELSGPLCARLGPDGLLYVASEGTNSIERFSPSTFERIDTFVAPGAGGLSGPTSLSWDPQGRLYVSSFNNDRVLRYTTTGAPDSTFIAAGAGGLNGPDNGTTFGPDGNLYVPSYYSNRILKYNGSTGAYMGAVGGVIANPRVLLFRGNDLFVTSEGANAVLRINWQAGTSLGNFVAAGAGGLSTPVGMAFAPDGRLLVTSLGNDSVLAYDGLTGAPLGAAVSSGLGGLDGPAFITVIPAPAGAVVMLALCWMRRRR